MRSLVFIIALAFFPLNVIAQCGGGGDSGGDCMGGGYCPPECMQCNLLDPIMINLGGGPWQLSGLSDPVHFDAQANGRLDSVGWTARGSNIAFLAFDRNGNGAIDDGSELFSNTVTLPNGQRAANGFEALAQYDSNGDGVIDKNDPIWNSLLLWIDRNHDGISQPGELTPISASPITAIELQHHWTNRLDQSGNRFGYEGVLHRGDLRQSFYDVFFIEAR